MTAYGYGLDDFQLVVDTGGWILGQGILGFSTRLSDDPPSSTDVFGDFSAISVRFSTSYDADGIHAEVSTLTASISVRGAVTREDFPPDGTPLRLLHNGTARWTGAISRDGVSRTQTRDELGERWDIQITAEGVDSLLRGHIVSPTHISDGGPITGEVALKRYYRWVTGSETEALTHAWDILLDGDPLHGMNTWADEAPPGEVFTGTGLDARRWFTGMTHLTMVPNPDDPASDYLIYPLGRTWDIGQRYSALSLAASAAPGSRRVVNDANGAAMTIGAFPGDGVDEEHAVPIEHGDFTGDYLAALPTTRSSSDMLTSVSLPAGPWADDDDLWLHPPYRVLAGGQEGLVTAVTHSITKQGWLIDIECEPVVWAKNDFIPTLPIGITVTKLSAYEYQFDFDSAWQDHPALPADFPLRMLSQVGYRDGSLRATMDDPVYAVNAPITPGATSLYVDFEGSSVQVAAEPSGAITVQFATRMRGDTSTSYGSEGIPVGHTLGQRSANFLLSLG